MALLSRERLVASLSTLFGVVALLLASVGLYGLMSFSVVQRTGEMGLRMALGAARPSVVRMIMREAMLLVVIGLVIGVPCALLDRAPGLEPGVGPALRIDAPPIRSRWLARC